MSMENNVIEKQLKGKIDTNYMPIQIYADAKEWRNDEFEGSVKYFREIKKSKKRNYRSVCLPKLKIVRDKFIQLSQFTEARNTLRLIDELIMDLEGK